MSITNRKLRQQALSCSGEIRSYHLQQLNISLQQNQKSYIQVYFISQVHRSWITAYAFFQANHQSWYSMFCANGSYDLCDAAIH